MAPPWCRMPCSKNNVSSPDLDSWPPALGPSPKCCEVRSCNTVAPRPRTRVARHQSSFIQRRICNRCPNRRPNQPLLYTWLHQAKLWCIHDNRLIYLGGKYAHPQNNHLSELLINYYCTYWHVLWRRGQYISILCSSRNKVERAIKGNMIPRWIDYLGISIVQYVR